MKTLSRVKTVYEAACEIRLATEGNMQEAISQNQMVGVNAYLLNELFDALGAFAGTEAGTMVNRLLESGDHTTRDVHREAARVIEAQATLAQIQAH